MNFGGFGSDDKPPKRNMHPYPEREERKRSDKEKEERDRRYRDELQGRNPWERRDYDDREDRRDEFGFGRSEGFMADGREENDSTSRGWRGPRGAHLPVYRGVGSSDDDFFGTRRRSDRERSREERPRNVFGSARFTRDSRNDDYWSSFGGHRPGAFKTAEPATSRYDSNGRPVDQGRDDWRTTSRPLNDKDEKKKEKKEDKDKPKQGFFPPPVVTLSSDDELKDMDEVVELTTITEEQPKKQRIKRKADDKSEKSRKEAQNEIDLLMSMMRMSEPPRVMDRRTLGLQTEEKKPKTEVVHFKVLLDNGEYQRFALTRVSNTPFFPFVQERCQMIGGLDAKIVWIDDENTRILLSCEEDLDTAIDYANQRADRSDSVPSVRLALVKPGDQPAQKRVRINEETEKKTTEKKKLTPEEKELESVKAYESFNTVVVCDGCESYITAENGGRYKCMICPDYDLCSDCARAGIHQEHAFIYLANKQTKLRYDDYGTLVERSYVDMMNIDRGLFNRAGYAPFWDLPFLRSRRGNTAPQAPKPAAPTVPVASEDDTPNAHNRHHHKSRTPLTVRDAMTSQTGRTVDEIIQTAGRRHRRLSGEQSEHCKRHEKKTEKKRARMAEEEMMQQLRRESEMTSTRMYPDLSHLQSSSMSPEVAAQMNQMKELAELEKADKILTEKITQMERVLDDTSMSPEEKDKKIEEMMKEDEGTRVQQHKERTAENATRSNKKIAELIDWSDEAEYTDAEDVQMSDSTGVETVEKKECENEEKKEEEKKEEGEKMEEEQKEEEKHTDPQLFHHLPSILEKAALHEALFQVKNEQCQTRLMQIRDALDRFIVGAQVHSWSHSSGLNDLLGRLRSQVPNTLFPPLSFTAALMPRTPSTNPLLPPVQERMGVAERLRPRLASLMHSFAYEPERARQALLTRGMELASDANMKKVKNDNKQAVEEWKRELLGIGETPEQQQASTAFPSFNQLSQQVEKGIGNVLVHLQSLKEGRPRDESVNSQQGQQDQQHEQGTQQNELNEQPQQPQPSAPNPEELETEIDCAMALLNGEQQLMFERVMELGVSYDIAKVLKLVQKHRNIHTVVNELLQ